MNKIVARFIVQIAGKPVENVDKALEAVEKKLKEEDKFDTLETEIIEAEFEEESKLYSGLIETQIEFQSIEHVLEFVVDYTPNSVEIEEPDQLKMDLATFNGILNDFATHILQSNAKVRILNANLLHYQKKLKELEKK